MDFRKGEEAVAVAAIIDERRLQRRFNPRHLGEVDITLELPPFSGFKIKFLYTVPVDDGDPGLLRVARVDEHALDHLIFSRRAGRRRGQGHPPQARDMQNDGRLALAIRRSGGDNTVWRLQLDGHAVPRIAEIRRAHVWTTVTK